MLKCQQAHSFDIAREGYVNLLRTKITGDSKEMLTARRKFLERGHYRLLSDAVNELISVHSADEARENEPLTMLDAGCGEGYYTARLQAYLVTRRHRPRCIGLDLSKDAVRMAARRYKQVFFVAANLKERLVIADQALHGIINIFAPHNVEEFARVLVPGGIAVVVIPAPDHLRSLRTMLSLLDIEENKQQHVIDQFTPRFTLLATTSLRYALPLNAAEVAELVTMTPNYWHLSPEMRAVMAHVQQVQTEVACTCLVFQRR